MFEMDARGVLRVPGWSRHAWLAHGFSTRRTGDFGDRPPREQVAAAFGTDWARPVTLRQVHAASCIRVEEHLDGDPPEADAVLTDTVGVLAGIRTADCYPILLVDPDRRAVAAVHAGWRGVAGRVLPNAIAGMVTEFGSVPAGLDAAIGPGIGACCFEVGEEVAGRFADGEVDRTRARPRVDLVAALETQLRAAGVDRVALAGSCTSCDVDTFYSHRAERGNTGRMLAVAGIRPGCGP